MSRISKLFGIVTSEIVQTHDVRREPEFTAAGKHNKKQDPVHVAVDWLIIKEHLQAEVRGLVSKSLVESIYGVRPGVSPYDQNVLLQAAANRLYADVLYKILSIGVTPPFEPAEEILRWAEDALDDVLRGWQGEDSGAKDRQYEPLSEVQESTTEAIYEALRRASKEEVLHEAAKKRFQADAAMVAAEKHTLEPKPV